MSNSLDLPYSPVIKSGNTIYTAGQIGRDPETGITQEGIKSQTRQAMENIATQLESVGATINNIVKTTIFLVSMDDYVDFNEVYRSFFSEPYPARTCVSVRELPRVGQVDLVVEIEAIAII